MLQFPRIKTTPSGRVIRYKFEIIDGRKLITYEDFDQYEVKECGFCNGSGKFWGTSINPSDNGGWCGCDKCDGTGEIETLIEEEDAE